MRAWFTKWLPIVFGCHCRADRSFFYHGRQFPICARCTGELIGILTALMGYAFFHPSVWLTALLLLPMLADGWIQALTPYTSTNFRRLITGILFGYGLFTLFLMSVIATFLYGYHYGLTLFH
ncbi:MAG: DUF2085 domain-containing protein [Lachnospiraceae bacterium]|nr:DUF2085 domain-containing protein [Lachnospiraceae bacterium]